MRGQEDLFRRWALRAVFALGVLGGLFWTGGLLLEELAGLFPPAWLWAVAVFAAGGCALAWQFTRSPGFLAVPPQVPWWRIFLRLALATVAAYLLLLPVFWSLGWLLVRSWPDPGHADAGLFPLVVGLWMPLWWAPALAAFLAWRGL
jgi:hypothetical protein